VRNFNTRDSPWSRIFLEKLLVAQLRVVEKFLSIYWNSSVITVFKIAPPFPEPDESSPQFFTLYL